MWFKIIYLSIWKFSEMLHFRECCDLLSLITPPGNRNDEAVPAPEIKLVGQERDGSILYIWDDFPENNQKGEKVTHIGVYKSGATPENKVLFICLKKFNVVQCSVNLNHTFLALVTAEKKSEHLHGNKDGNKDDEFTVYEAYLVDTEQRPFSVYNFNFKKRNLVHVQFRYDKTITTNEMRLNKTSDLLVFLHKESIAMYHIQATNKEAIPLHRVDNVAKQFLWAQWDMINQRLYFIHFRSTPYGHTNEDKTLKPKLSCLQFHDLLPFETVLNFPLNFPGLDESLMKYCANYIEMPLSHKITDPEFHMEILTQPSGAVHLCYQYVFRNKYSSVMQSISQEKSESMDLMLDFDTCNLAYYVALLHHNCLLDCVAFNIPQREAEGCRLYFGYLKDHIIVIAPGLFAHLLDIDLHHEPSHHILYHDMPIAPFETRTSPGGAMASFLSNLNIDEICAASVTTYLDSSSILDCHSKKIYTMSINKEALLLLFQDTLVATTRLAIMHYFVIHEMDMTSIRKLFESMLNDIVSPEIPALFQEFLLGSTYLAMAMKRQIDKDYLKFMPLSTRPAKDQQVEKNKHKERLARITYQELKNVVLSVTTPQVRFLPHKETDMWTTLWKHLQYLTDKKHIRFNLHSIQEKLLQKNQSLDISDQPQHEKDSINKTVTRVRRVSTVAFAVETPLVGKVYLPFTIQDDFHGKPDITVPIITREFLNHLQTFLSSESKTKLLGIISEYINCQMLQSRILCHLLLTVSRYNPNAPEILALTLAVPATDKEHFILDLFERYILAAEDLVFPIPSGFRDFITNLAFRCLPFSNFIQYVNNQVFFVNEEFVKNVITDLDDSSDHVFIKQKLISMLSKDKQTELLKKWNHPYSVNLIAKNIALECLASQDDDTVIEATEQTNLENSNETTNFVGSVSFPPLDILLQVMKKNNPNKEIKDFQMIAKTALYHSSHHYEQNYNLS